MMKNSELMFDRRIVDRNLDKGLVSEADYKAYLASLTDTENNAERVVVGEGADEGDED